MKKHANIPIFIPHLGCKNDCVFCNQKKITGVIRTDYSSVTGEIERGLASLTDIDTENIQIAYFGGSFTGIDRADMIYLLKLAYGYVKAGKVNSIRLSTRPDYINGEILDILKEYGVRTVELGIQSMDDKVLSACHRGHTVSDSVSAMERVKSAGFELVGQMMTMLPGADGESEIRTASELCKRGCDAARVYPLVIFKDTPLVRMVDSGEYGVCTSEEMIERTASVLEVFDSYKVPVIRVGLQSNDSLVSGESIYAGIYDEAIGERCRTRIYRRIIERELGEGFSGNCVVRVSPEKISRVIGIRAENRVYFKDKGINIKVVPDGTVKDGILVIPSVRGETV